MQPSTVDVVIASDGMAHISFAENIQTMTKEPPSPKRRNKHPDSEQPNIEIEATDEKPSVVFIFDSYSLVVPNREGLAEDVVNNPDKWLALAKKADYDKAAEKVRAERNQLLTETDKEMAFDRLNIAIPNKITTSTLLACVKGFFEAMAAIKNSPMAKYRKALRDIPEQEGFPYNVVFPNKPN